LNIEVDLIPLALHAAMSFGGVTESSIKKITENFMSTLNENSEKSGVLHTFDMAHNLICIVFNNLNEGRYVKFYSKSHGTSLDI